MKSVNRFASFLVPGIATLILIACANQKESARRALDEVYDHVMATAEESAKYVPDQLAAVQTELRELQGWYDKKDYAAVLGRAPAVLADANTVATQAAAKKVQMAKTLDMEWSGFVGTLPQWISSVIDRLRALSKRKRVPGDIDLAAARSALDDATDGWERAQAAKASGDVDNAVSTAKDVKSKIEAAAAALKLQLPPASH